MKGLGRRGHSRLERVLNSGGHGPLGWAASSPRRRCRRARAQPGLRRPLCRPARYDFIHSWGCGASRAGRAGGGARPIPAPPSAPRDVESRGARRRPRAPPSGLHVPGGVGRAAHPLAPGDTGRSWVCSRASFPPPRGCSSPSPGSASSRHRGRRSRWSLASGYPQGMGTTQGLSCVLVHACSSCKPTRGLINAFVPLLSAFFAPGPLLGTGDTAVTKLTKSLPSRS